MKNYKPFRKKKIVSKNFKFIALKIFKLKNSRILLFFLKSKHIQQFCLTTLFVQTFFKIQTNSLNIFFQKKFKTLKVFLTIRKELFSSYLNILFNRPIFFFSDVPGIGMVLQNQLFLKLKSSSFKQTFQFSLFHIIYLHF